MIEALTVFLFGILNRVRGGGFGAHLLPGRPLFWVGPVIGAIATYFFGIYFGVLFALTYASWASLSWGRWFTFGRIPAPREINIFERWVEFFPRKITTSPYWLDFFSFFIRNNITLLPLILSYFIFNNIVILYAIPVLSLLIVILYSLSWKFSLKHPILIAEILVGILWGLLLFSAYML